MQVLAVLSSLQDRPEEESQQYQVGDPIDGSARVHRGQDGREGQEGVYQRGEDEGAMVSILKAADGRYHGDESAEYQGRCQERFAG